MMNIGDFARIGGISPRMLRLRRLQIQADVDDEYARLRRVEAHLRALEGSDTMPADIIIKTTEPLRIAEATGSATGFGHDNLGPVFERLLPEVWSAIARADAKPGISVAWYEWPDDDSDIIVHAGFAIGDQTVPASNGVRAVELPAIEVASVIHRGSMESVTTTYESLVSWIESNGLQIAGRSRELYHEWNDSDPSQCVTELQMPIAR